MISNTFKNIIKSTINFQLNSYRFVDSVSNLKKDKQAKIAKKLKQHLAPTFLEVTDTTLGGSSCGQMYKITIQSPLFQGKSKVAQHQMVSQCLAEELKKIHAFNLKTKVSKKQETLSQQFSVTQNPKD